jgi:hypothetical protein
VELPSIRDSVVPHGLDVTAPANDGTPSSAVVTLGVVPNSLARDLLAWFAPDESTHTTSQRAHLTWTLQPNGTASAVPGQFGCEAPGVVVGHTASVFVRLPSAVLRVAAH